MAKWDDVITEAHERGPENLAEAVRDELGCLWDDLDHEIRHALRDGWSVKCDSLTARIVTLSRFAGATDWHEVQVGLLQSGVYQGILTSAGIEFEKPDMAEVNALAERIRGR